jgi:rhodanese-related sulfurtransferase
LLPRVQLELRVHTLQQMGFKTAVALDGGMKAWRESGRAVQTGKGI